MGYPAEWHHLCYDELESAQRAAAGDDHWDPSHWRKARVKVQEVVSGRLSQANGRRAILLLDDNMYYRSMRKEWYHLARDRACTFRQVFLRAPEDVCLERNRCRHGSNRVPDFSIKHMAEVFEWPRCPSETWEGRGKVTVILDAETAVTSQQVQTFIDIWKPEGSQDLAFWAPLPQEDVLEPATGESATPGHLADVALRRIVSRAIAEAPKELGQARSILAKQWGSRKADLMAQAVAASKGRSAEEVSNLIHEMEGVFLSCCVADLKKAAKVLRGVPSSSKRC